MEMVTINRGRQDEGEGSRLFRDPRWLGRLTPVSNTGTVYLLVHHGGRHGRQQPVLAWECRRAANVLTARGASLGT